MTFEEFKDFLQAVVLCSRASVELLGNLLKVNLEGYPNKTFVLSEQEYNEYINERQKNIAKNDFELLTGNHYEVLLKSNTRHFHYEEIEDYEDKNNNISYKYGTLSPVFIIHLINLDMDIRMWRDIMRPSYYAMFHRVEDYFPNDENSIMDLLSKVLFKNYYSLQIDTGTTLTLAKLQSYMYSFVYTYMYNMQTSLYPCFDIQTLLPQRNHSYRDREMVKFDYPKKIYNQELIAYYNEAIDSSILSHKYLSFYHILEYYYERIFSEDQIKKAREIIMDVAFSYKRDKDVVKLIKGIQAKTSDKEFAVNEKTALKLLIQKHIKQEALKEKLTERYGDEYIDLLNKKVGFSDGNAIIFSVSEENQYVDSLMNRIYKTRNSIVHSKESFFDEKKNNKYQWGKDDKELLVEIDLIQVVAEIVINETSKDL